MSDNVAEKPWYQDGLQFSCTGCGNCCTGPAGYVWVSEEEIVRIAEFRNQSVGELRLFHLAASNNANCSTGCFGCWRESFSRSLNAGER